MPNQKTAKALLEFNTGVFLNLNYVKITGNLTTGLLLSQLVYWAGKMKWKEFYKTNQEICEETGMTTGELKLAKKKLSKFDFIQITVKGAPAKTHYQVKPGRLSRAIISWFIEKERLNEAKSPSWAESTQLDGQNQPNWTGRINPTIHTEDYHKTTQNICAAKKNFAAGKSKNSKKPMNQPFYREPKYPKRARSAKQAAFMACDRIAYHYLNEVARVFPDRPAPMFSRAKSGKNFTVCRSAYRYFGSEDLVKAHITRYLESGLPDKFGISITTILSEWFINNLDIAIKNPKSCGAKMI